MTTASTKEYSARSSARRAAKAAGLDPDRVEQAASGKWLLPNKPLAEMTEASRLAYPSRAHPLDIPEELRVENRKPLPPEQQARLSKVMTAAGGGPKTERVDHRKPKGTSWEEWDAHMAAEAASRREQSLERVAALRAKHPPKAKRLPKPRREDAYQPTDVIRVLADKNPCREGTAAHAVFKKYRDGMTVAAFAKAAASACPGRLRPVDYLIYDSKKGRISVGTAKKGAFPK